jgi:phosphoribosylamine--glycine ligase
MNVLVVGSGGREHALVWALCQSPRVKRIYACPGNPGIAALAETLPISPTEVPSLVRAAEELSIDLTVVGPEAPLVAGIVDAFRDRGLRIFGPTAAASLLEGSKVFAKELMRRSGIPTAESWIFSDPSEAKTFVRKAGRPLVVKADGLAGGKGAIVAMTPEEGVHAVGLLMEERIFGESGSRVVIEEFLEGEEVSFFALSDGRTVLPLLAVRDHKRLRDGDHGPNTGGMGAYAPVPFVDEALVTRIMREILVPTVEAMSRERRPFTGVLYAGLMLTRDGPKVLEFNVRFGDPEAQVLLPLLQTDVLDLLEAVVEGQLDDLTISWRDGAAACVVLASKGYPDRMEAGSVIEGLDGEKPPGVLVFHAGTGWKEGKVVASGGRVLNVVGLGRNLQEAVERAYLGVEQIRFEGMQYRKDIGPTGFVGPFGTAGQNPLSRRPDSPAPLVGIVLGSDSDLPVMEEATRLLEKFGIPYEVTIASAHRSPRRALTYAETAGERGLKVLIAAAGGAAHLPGVLASSTPLPVIGVPMEATPLGGLDSLLSMVQMPGGVPVAVVSIGKAGARNAAILAAQILGTADSEIRRRVESYKAELAREVEAKSSSLSGRPVDSTAR